MYLSNLNLIVSYSLSFSSLLSLTSNSLTRFVAKSIIINSIVDLATKSIANSLIFNSSINSFDTKVVSIENFAYIIFAIINKDKKKKKEEDKKIINKKEKKRNKEKKDIREVRIN